MIKKFNAFCSEREETVDVTNKIGCEDGDWIRAWAACAGKDIDNPPICCSNPKCENYGVPLDKDNRVGGHLHVKDDAPNTFYIAPICKGCNKKTYAYKVLRSRMIPLAEVKKHLNDNKQIKNNNLKNSTQL